MRRVDSYKKYKHLIGTKINEWTVLDIIVHDENEKHHTYLRVQCSCGEIREIYITEILGHSGKEKKYCDRCRRKKLDEAVFEQYNHLLGTTIHGWTVLKIIPPNDKHKKTYALCMCRCGTVKEVKMKYLLDGKSKDCGCGRKEMLRETRTKNLVGQKFGKLTVVELLEDSNQFARRVYKCRCDCGNDTTVPSNSLLSHQTLSCGCLQSHGNMYINRLLTDKNIEHKCEYTVHIGDSHYRFDFYLPQYNLFIEYDGEQHFYPVSFGADEFTTQKQFELTQKRDKIKNKYCEDNKINLLRIPYWEKENIETIINNHLQRLSIEGYAEAVQYATVWTATII